MPPRCRSPIDIIRENRERRNRQDYVSLIVDPRTVLSRPESTGFFLRLTCSTVRRNGARYICPPDYPSPVLWRINPLIVSVERVIDSNQ
jgi:hypothetical protein